MLDQLVAKVTSFELARPLRIAIDGRTASGKTTFADELAQRIRIQNREIIRTSIDEFHLPKADRYARGRLSAEGYYHDGYDLPAVVAFLLRPLGPGGDRLYRTASFDLVKDQPVEQEPKLAPEDAILIVDGTFLQRPELVAEWDLVIFLESSEEVSESRGINRDRELLGGEDSARRLYAERYLPAFEQYERLCSPKVTADAIVNNDDFEFPILSIPRDSRLAVNFQ
ncbi:uridylate kinase [Beijerinckia indica]|nr:uridylate kinase [Beijerinckia indica]